MSTYVVYASLLAPKPPLPKWERLRHTITGWNGTSFDLTRGDAGVLMLRPGVTGMHLPEFDQHVDEHASVDGGRYRGTRTRMRHPSWTIGVFGRDSQDWRDRDAAFWAILHPDRPLLWTITDPEGQARTLMCRLRSSTEHQYDRDPMYWGWAIYTVDLLAEDPFWQGTPIQSPLWEFTDSSTPFTGPDDAAPSYHISAASTLVGSAELTNPGDVDAYLSWEVTGPLDSVTISAGGGQLGYGPILPGQVLRIVTDPTRPLALLGGVDVTGQVVPWNPRPIPAGETSPVTIELVGDGSVQASFVPRYRRAL